MPSLNPKKVKKAFIKPRGGSINARPDFAVVFPKDNKISNRAQVISPQIGFDLHLLSSQPNSDLLSMLAGINVTERWLQVALSVAHNHSEYIDALEQQAVSKFSGSGLANVRSQFEASRTKKVSLFQNILKIAENITPVTPVENCPQTNKIAGDPELARLAVALNQAPQFRLWLVALQMVRDTNKLRISRADLQAALRKYGITVSERNLRRWLKFGHGLFWELTERFIYFAGYEKVACRLVERAVHKNLLDLISTNRPGKRSMYIDVSGSLQQFEASVYAAWLAYRENPTIARSTLSALFNREPRILRQWDKLAGVEVITNEAQFAPDYFADVPEYGYMYQAGTGNGHSETRFRARMVNTYHAPSIKQHGKRGQSRRVFHAVGKYLDSVIPTGTCEQGRGSNAATGGLKPTGRRYFENSVKARSSAKRNGNRQRYVVLGMNKNQQMVWDYTMDGRQRTTRREELPLITQRKFTPKPVYAKDVIYA